MTKLKILILFITGLCQKFKIEKDLGLLFEEDGSLILANGGVQFKLLVEKPIPTFEFSGGCLFNNEDLEDMAEKLNIDSEKYTMKTHGGSEVLNTLVTEALVQKDLELTNEIRARFLGKITDRTPQFLDIKEGIKQKGVERCNDLLECQFTHDLMPRACNFGKRDNCGSLYVCCDLHHRNETVCPQGAYKELKQFLEIEDSLGRPREYTAYCIRIVSANKPMVRSKRSLGEYWASGGIFNVLTGGYTDKKIHIEELERINKDNQLQSGILENKNSILTMNLAFTDLQRRLNNHICELTKDLVENILHFEATTIFNEAKIELDMDLQSCFEGFLPLSIPNEKLVHICKDILGNEHKACHMSYSLFSCENIDLYLEHNVIKHTMKVFFSRPLEGFTATKIHTLPIPVENTSNKYVQLYMDSKIVFENKGLSKRIIFKKCENRKTFWLCQLGSEHQILADNCLENILDNNSSQIRTNCKIERLNGYECVYRVINGNVFLSSHVDINVYKNDNAKIGFEQERLIQKQKGLFQTTEGFVNFNCGEIMYQNVQIPNITIQKGSVSLKFSLNELPIRHIEIPNNGMTGNVIEYEIIGFYSLGGIIIVGCMIWIIKILKRRIEIEITARRIERLRTAITPRIEIVDTPRNRHVPSLVSMD